MLWQKFIINFKTYQTVLRYSIQYNHMAKKLKNQAICSLYQQYWKALIWSWILFWKSSKMYWFIAQMAGTEHHNCVHWFKLCSTLTSGPLKDSLFWLKRIGLVLDINSIWDSANIRTTGKSHRDHQCSSSSLTAFIKYCYSIQCTLSLIKNSYYLLLMRSTTLNMELSWAIVPRTGSYLSLSKKLRACGPSS